MDKKTGFPIVKYSAKQLEPTSLPPIKVPRYVRDFLRTTAKVEDRDLTKQTRKVLVDYVNARLANT